MSKAFTKEDDDAGFTAPSSARIAIPPGPFRLTTTGARLAAASADERVREAVGRAEILPRASSPDRAALGVTVVVAAGAVLHGTASPRRYRLVSAEERVLLGNGCSVDGPIGRALVGAAVGDAREVLLPRGAVEELEVIALEGETEA